MRGALSLGYSDEGQAWAENQDVEVKEMAACGGKPEQSKDGGSGKELVRDGFLLFFPTPPLIPPTPPHHWPHLQGAFAVSPTFKKLLK